MGCSRSSAVDCFPPYLHVNSSTMPLYDVCRVEVLDAVTSLTWAPLRDRVEDGGPDGHWLRA